MTPAVTVVDAATQLAPATNLLPGPIWVVFSAFHNVHRLWWWYRKKEMYTQPNNFLHLVSGHTLNFVLGDMLVIRVAAQALLIATRILEAVEQKVVFCLSWRKWTQSVRGHYTPHIRCKWDKKTETSLFSPSTRNWAESLKRNAAARIDRVMKNTLGIGKNGFMLSMRLMDAAEAFSLSPETKTEAVSEFFLNGSKSISTIVENKERLRAGLIENKGLIDKCLSGIGSSYKSEQLIGAVSKTLEKTETTYNTVSKVAGVANNAALDTLKRGIFAFMNTIGLASWTPDSLVPTLDPPWVNPAPPKLPERFPPTKWVTRISKTIAAYPSMAIDFAKQMGTFTPPVKTKIAPQTLAAIEAPPTPMKLTLEEVSNSYKLPPSPAKQLQPTSSIKLVSTPSTPKKPPASPKTPYSPIVAKKLEKTWNGVNWNGPTASTVY